jgi:N-carbamoylputrescine amidase
LLLLPEMPFHQWLAGSPKFDPDRWQASVTTHQRRIARLADFTTAVVIGSRPLIQSNRRVNQGFVWEASNGCRGAHTKFYLPNEAGYWEANWYQRGDGRFEIIEVKGVKIGFLICTELWFNAHARAYAARGIHLLVCPRVTPLTSTDKWIAGGRTAAVIAGAFCLSSNLNGPHVDGMAFGGAGWIIEPEAGGLLGVTSMQTPVLTIDIDPSEAEKAKKTYPRYVPD